MNIKKYIREDLIFDLKAGEKLNILKEMAGSIADAAGFGSREAFVKDITDREKQLSTGIGLGIAVPHAQTEETDDFLVGIGRIREGILFESIDDKPVHIIIMIARPVGRQKDYINLLASVVSYAKNKGNFNRLLKENPQKLIESLK